MWNDPELRKLFLDKTPLIDVRAPIEFQDGAIPHSINLPLMNDEERRQVGTCYKQLGQAAAIELGHQLVSGEIKETRVKNWRNFIQQYPETEVFCFRGGLRSQISCQWLNETGISKKPLPGGYKRLRHFFLSILNDAPLPKMIRLGGLTGSGKTLLLEKVPHHLDLENLANHRGSAFGPRGYQPSQITFENKMALELLGLQGKIILVEDESATIGQLTVPQRLFSTLRDSPMIILETSHEERLQNIFNEYVKPSSRDFFLTGLGKIQKRLGGVKFKFLSDEISKAFESPMELAFHEAWISILLKEYYDPLYQKGIRYNQEKILFQGNQAEVLSYLAHM